MKGNIYNSKLPFIFSNFAMTADGKIAFAGREFVPFGSDKDREHMMELRASADAVMSGARTVETPGVTLGPGGVRFQRLRLDHGLSEFNLRVIVSGSGSLNTGADIFKHRFSPIIILTSQSAPEKYLRQLRRAADAVGVFGDTEVDLPAAVQWLRRQWKVKRLLCEGGGVLHNAVIRAGLLDELHLTMCPKIFGGLDAPTIADGPGFARLSRALTLRLKSARRIGSELFAVFAAAKSA